MRQTSVTTTACTVVMVIFEHLGMHIVNLSVIPGSMCRQKCWNYLDELSPLVMTGSADLCCVSQIHTVRSTPELLCYSCIKILSILVCTTCISYGFPHTNACWVPIEPDFSLSESHSILPSGIHVWSQFLAKSGIKPYPLTHSLRWNSFWYGYNVWPWWLYPFGKDCYYGYSSCSAIGLAVCLLVCFRERTVRRPMCTPRLASKKSLSLPGWEESE